MPEIVLTMLSVLSIKEYHLKTRKHYVGLMSISHNTRIPVILLSQQLDLIESQLYRLFQNGIKIVNRVNVRELTCVQNCFFIFIGKSFISSKHMFS